MEFVKRNIGLFLLGGIFLLEGVLLAFYSVDSEDGKDAEEKKPKVADVRATGVDGQPLADGVEVSLGEYRERNDSFPGPPMTVDVAVAALVPFDGEAEFNVLYEKRRQRVREAIVRTIRSADYREFRQPGLTTLKYRILESIRTSFTAKRMLIDRIFIPSFSISS
ncbi:hypothetical protein Pan216_46470 [Planctomycetes bacterium Pan216]|uniref:Flagellar protein FliL n=1 Tax=Kolteria novifilia TaxID=2527975 RepID=A0A518B9V3_9BACT|nr:hypothetical protein Pan216_46470 [Planctomycetes bacterium Pan216]